MSGGSCLLTEDGIPDCLGASDLLGDHETFTKIAIGSGYACGLTEDGSMECWGKSRRRPGNFRTDPPEGNFTHISISWSNACALKDDGTIHCWGGPRNHPVNSPPEGVYETLDVGSEFACAIKKDSSIDCWGLTEATVDPASEIWHRYSERVADPNSNYRFPADEIEGSYKAVDAKSLQACAVTTDDRVVCWGEFKNGETAYTEEAFTQEASWQEPSPTKSPDEPTPEPNLITGFEEISIYFAGSINKICVIETDRSITCRYLDTTRHNPQPVFSNIWENFTKLELGHDGDLCALNNHGELRCNTSRMPRGNLSKAEPIKDISYTSNFCFIANNGTAYCDRGAHQPPEGTSFTQIDSSATQGCGLREDGALECWGTGNWDLSSNIKKDIPVESHPGPFQQVRISNALTCALGTDGTIQCWTILEDIPMTSPPTGTYKKLDVKGGTGCAIRTDGGIDCWGIEVAAGKYNYEDREYEYFPNPLLEVPEGTYKDLDMSGLANQACAITTDDRVVCWGSFKNGEVEFE